MDVEMKILASLTILAAALAATCLQAQTSPWLVRVRAVGVEPANNSDAFSALGINFASGAVHVSSKTIPEVDISYFFTENFSTELILTYPQSHTVTLQGVGALGTFKELPPTLTAQWHFLPGGAINPYVGAGLNLTLISSTSLSVAGHALDLSTSSVGVAGQVGVDIKLAPQWFLNADIKYVQIKSDVKLAAGGTKLTTAQLNPMLYGVGVGYRF